MSEPEKAKRSFPEWFTQMGRWLPAQGDRPEGMFVHCGGPVGRLTASLRIFGDDLVPDEISKILGCEPNSVVHKGDTYTRRSKSVRKESGWMLNSRRPESASLDEHLADLLSRVNQNEATWRTLTKYMPDIFVGVFLTEWNQGVSVAPENSAILGKLGIQISLDIYSHLENDNET